MRPAYNARSLQGSCAPSLLRSRAGCIPLPLVGARRLSADRALCNASAVPPVSVRFRRCNQFFLSPIETIGILRQLADNGWVMNPIAVTVWSQFGEESYFCAWQASRLLGKAYEVPAVGPRSNVSIRKSTLHHHQRVPPLRAFGEPWPMYALDAKTGKIVWEFYLVPKAEGDPTRGPLGASPLNASTWGNSMQGVPITGGATCR